MLGSGDRAVGPQHFQQLGIDGCVGRHTGSQQQASANAGSSGGFNEAHDDFPEVRLAGLVLSVGSKNWRHYCGRLFQESGILMAKL
jgi:hypothetical protein